MNETGERKRSWVDLVILVISFSGAILSFFGSVSTYTAQAQIAGTSLWPLPGLALLDWVLAGALGFAGVYFSVMKGSNRWRIATWSITGAFIPLIILGIFSIGPSVFLAFLLFLASTVILTVRYRTNLLVSFGMLMLGSIANLAILMGIIIISGQVL